MAYIDLGIIEATAQELEQLAGNTRAAQKLVEQLIEESRYAFQEDLERGDSAADCPFDLLPAGQCLSEAATALEMETQSLARAAESLEKIVLLYRHAQKRVQDVMQGDIVVIPRTEFGTSHFENLRSCCSLIPVSSEPGSGSTGDLYREKTSWNRESGTKSGSEKSSNLPGIL